MKSNSQQSYSNSSIYSSQYEEELKIKDVKPLPLLGRLPVKFQYGLASLLMMAGVVGATYTYTKFNDDLTKKTYIADLLSRSIQDYTEKATVLKKAETNLYYSLVEQQELKKQNEYLEYFTTEIKGNKNSKNFVELISALDLVNGELPVEYVITSLKKISTQYKKVSDYLVESGKFHQANLLAQSQLASAFEKMTLIYNDRNRVNLLIERGLRSHFDESFQTLSQMQQILAKVHDTTTFQLKAGELNKKLNILKEFFAGKGLEPTISMSVLEQKTIKEISALIHSVRIKDIVSALENMQKSVKSIENVQPTIEALIKLPNELADVQSHLYKSTQLSIGQSSWFFLSGLLILIGLLFLMLSRFKHQEMIKQYALSKTNNLLQSIDFINQDLRDYLSDRNMSIKLDEKDPRLNEMIGLINDGWRQGVERENVLLSEINNIQSNLKQEIDTFEKMISEQFLIQNGQNELSQQIRRLQSYKISLTAFLKYWDNHYESIISRNYDVKAAHESNAKLYVKLKEINEKIREKINALLLVGRELENVAEVVLGYTAKTKELAINLEIASYKDNINLDLFKEISRDIKEVANGYEDITRKLNIVTNNAFKNFDSFSELLLTSNQHISNESTVNKTMGVRLSEANKVESKIISLKDEMTTSFSSINFDALKEDAGRIIQSVSKQQDLVPVVQFHQSAISTSLHNIDKVVEGGK